ncbi:serine hydrolase [Sphingomonas xanthus]|uniref:beta-lactamase n=1 Tax=Sphingomonas xanthus TaxID=2594473 RepID=A0A516IRI8_9SPHN|nr:serine hydrolase [Sphingomonas xanthus]QDP19525.1 serine hydrolase [Sphingomonas xanthus]
MTSFAYRLFIAAGLVASPTASASQASDPLAPLPSDAVQQTRAVKTGPLELREQISSLSRAFPGIAGVSVMSIKDGWQIGYNDRKLFPQQSCSKLWVAITALDAVDRGRVSLNDRVTIGRDDLTLFHQPIRTKVLGNGSHTTTLGALLQSAITESDNTANDKLMRSVGGPLAVRDMIDSKRLGSIRFYEGERALQSRIAGLIWSQSYSVGDAFYKARGALPSAVRKASFERYIADPYDGAAPQAVTQSLARLKRGELLSPASTQRLLSTMASTKTGALRVRAAMKPGWKWSHKTGTGQNFQGRVGGINDIGILTAPDGTAYAMAIMTVPSKSDGAAQEFMQKIARAVIADHEARRGG